MFSYQCNAFNTVQVKDDRLSIDQIESEITRGTNPFCVCYPKTFKKLLRRGLEGWRRGQRDRGTQEREGGRDRGKRMKGEREEERGRERGTREGRAREEGPGRDIYIA